MINPLFLLLCAALADGSSFFKKYQKIHWRERDRKIKAQIEADRELGGAGCPEFQPSTCKVPLGNKGLKVLLSDLKGKMAAKYWEIEGAEGTDGILSEEAALIGSFQFSPSATQELRCGLKSLEMNDLWNPRGHIDLDGFTFLERGKELLRDLDPLVVETLCVHLARQTAHVEGFRPTVAATRAMLRSRAPKEEAEREESLTSIVQGFGRAVEAACVMAKRPPSAWTQEDIVALHREACPSADPGIRKADVLHGEGTLPPLGEELPELMRHYVDWLGWVERSGCRHPALFAIDALLLLNSIHPFSDCNGRTSRLVMTAILLHHRIVPPLFILAENTVDLVRDQNDAYFGDRRPIIQRILVKMQQSAAEFPRMRVGEEDKVKDRDPGDL